MNIENCWYKGVCTNKCTSGCLRYNCMLSLLNQSNIPQNLWKKQTLHANDSDISVFRLLAKYKEDIVTHVESGDNIYIWSETCGNGKTSWAINLMLAYFNSIWHKSGFCCKGVYVNVPSFLMSYRADINRPSEEFNALCNNIKSCDLVIWDDIATTKLTDYEHSILYTYIDGRINDGKSNIFTGNCNYAECKNKIGDRLTSRIMHAVFDTYQFKEFDKRGLK